MSALTFEDYLRVESTSQRFVSLKLVHIDMTGDLMAGVLLSRLVYWHSPNRETGEPRLTFERDGQLWLRKAHNEWHKECRLTVAQARRAVENLRELGLVETRVWKHNGTPTLHLRIVPEAFMAAFDAASSQVKPEMRQSANGLVAHSESDQPGIPDLRLVANGNAPQRTSEMRHSASPLPTEEITSKRTARSAAIEAVYTAWRDDLGRTAATKLTDDRRRRINARLDDNYTVEQLVIVVTRGWRADPWPERKHENDIEQLLRSAKAVDRFLRFAEEGRASPQQSARAAQLAVTEAKLARSGRPALKGAP